MLKRVLLYFGCLVALLTFTVFFANCVWFAPFPGKLQVEKDHGVHLPKSAVVLHRKNTGFLGADSHASADVVIAASDLPDFVKQLEPPNPKYMQEWPWPEKTPDGDAEYYCRSKCSDGRFYVKVKPMENGKVSLKLGTDTD